MDKKQTSIAVLGVATLIAVACVTASSWGGSTPLYTIRMEQVSSKMNFLPTAMNAFTYTADNGSLLTCEPAAYCGNCIPLVSGGVNTCETCPGHYTCYNTCPDTCEPSCEGTCFEPTCSSTCPVTCETCTQPTCETCETCSTCVTCPYTCSTCKGHDTCWDTCEIDCL